MGAPALQKMRGLLQRGRARGRRRPAPGGKAGARSSHRRIGSVRRCVGYGLEVGCLGLDVRQQPVERRARAEFDAARIAPLRREQIARQRNFGMGRRLRPDDGIGRTLQQRHNRHAIVGRLRHERRVGAVLQQPPHQIGEQVAMAADRGIGAVGDVGMILGELFVERFAHAVQALEFEAAAILRKLQHGRDRQRVVGGELREDARPQTQQLRRAGDVVQIRHRLAREHGIAVQPALLRALDLGVPIGALDQPHHQLAVMRAGERVDIVDHGAGALLIGLDRQPKAVPAAERGIGERRRDHVERQLQPVGFLGIDGEVQIMGLGALRQVEQLRHQLGHHARRG